MKTPIQVSGAAIFLLFFQFAAVFTGYAQSQDAMSYQAVVRDQNGALISQKKVGLKIQILHKTNTGTVLFAELHEPSTNVNGLITAEVGLGKTISGSMANIDWNDGPYYLRTDVDPAGGTDYRITGVTKLLSVPYALHSRTAETLVGGIKELDPHFKASVAAGIFSKDTFLWNNKLSFYHERDSVFLSSVAASIGRSDTSKWNKKQDKLLAGKGILIAGNTISATPDTVYQNSQSINFDFPDGFSTDSMVLLSNITSYTIPANKNFYITGWKGNPYFDFLVDSASFPGIGSYEMRPRVAFVLGAGMKLTTTKPLNISGFFVKKSVEYVCLNLNKSNYTVPNKKVFVFCWNAGSSVLVNGIGFNSPGMIDEKAVVSGSGSVLGYLINK